MSNIKTAENHPRLIPYLIVKNAAGVIEFLKEVFDAEESYKAMREDGSTIMHAEVRIGDSPVMLAEATSDYPPMPAGVYIYVADAEESYQRALEAGATSVMEPYSPEYADKAAGIKDIGGNTWWLTSVK